jgi:hypothetical protein
MSALVLVLALLTSILSSAFHDTAVAHAAIVEAYEASDDRAGGACCHVDADPEDSELPSVRPDLRAMSDSRSGDPRASERTRPLHTDRPPELGHIG